MIASEQDKEREGDANAVGVDASTDQQQATAAAGGAKDGHTSVSFIHDHATHDHVIFSHSAALFAAILANDVAAMACAVGGGVSVTAGLDDDGSTPLYFASRLGHVASMKWLVGQGADIHARNKNGSTALHQAAYSGQVASMEWLVGQGADVVHAKDANGSTPLHFAVQQDAVAMMEWLVRQGADIHAMNKHGSTPLHHAAYVGQVTAVEWLVGQGANIHAESKDGSTPLYVAAQEGEVATMEWLVRQGADIHARSKIDDSTPLHIAAISGQVVSMKWLVKQGIDIHARSENGSTALHYAAHSGQVASLELLAGQGVDIHAKNTEGSTPLHFAAQGGKVASMEWLVGQGADVQAMDKHGCTALYYAANGGQVLAIAWLKEQGVHMSIAEPTPAETAAPEMLSLPPTIAVIGVDEGYSGLYKKQQHTEGGRGLYKSTRADSKQAIWYDMDEHGGKWCLGEVLSDGIYDSRHSSCGWFAIAIDSAISPLSIEATWQELAWEPCSSIRVTKSKKKHTKVIEVKGVPDVFGGVLRHGMRVNGKYRPQAQIIDERPTYKGGPDSDQVIWYSASTGSWRVGPVIFAGTSRHFMHTKDTAATPNTVKTPWCVSTEYSLPNPCAKIILPSVEVAEQQVPRQMQLKMPKVMASEQTRCLGCGCQYTSQAEVVFHEECLHHHCVYCRDKLNGPSCTVCAEAMLGDCLENEEREDAYL
jgi:ankyrin repeat protein